MHMRGCAIVAQIVAASICQEHRWKMTGSTMNMKLAAICSGGHHSRPAVGPSAGAPPPVVMHGRRRGVARQANAAGSTAPGLRGPGGICLHLVGLAGPPVSSLLVPLPPPPLVVGSQKRRIVVRAETSPVFSHPSGEISSLPTPVLWLRRPLKRFVTI